MAIKDYYQHLQHCTQSLQHNTTKLIFSCRLDLFYTSSKEYYQHHLESRPVHRNVATWQTSEVVGIKKKVRRLFELHFAFFPFN